MRSIGIDSGSSTTKGVLFDGQEIVKTVMLPTGVNPRKSIKSVYDSLSGEEHIYTVTTGYGRELLVEADKTVTEITCHGKGASFLDNEIQGVIDIGGQDSKVILLDRNAYIKDFLMNDKCAAGTGRFVEVIMRILQQDIDDLPSYVKGAEGTKISSMCTVFAESEVVSLLAQDVAGPSIAKGVIDSICERTAIFSKRLPIENKIFFSGGLAQIDVFRETLENKLQLDIVTHELAQYAGAIGAAVIGFDKAKKTE